MLLLKAWRRPIMGGLAEAQQPVVGGDLGFGIGPVLPSGTGSLGAAELPQDPTGLAGVGGAACPSSELPVLPHYCFTPISATPHYCYTISITSQTHHCPAHPSTVTPTHIYAPPNPATSPHPSPALLVFSSVYRMARPQGPPPMRGGNKGWPGPPGLHAPRFPSLGCGSMAR